MFGAASFALLALSFSPQSVTGGAWEKQFQLLGAATEMLGETVIACPDLNGDGHPDFAASATWSETGGTKTGAVYAYSGKDGSTLWRFAPPQPHIELGASLAAIDDVDGDGIGDLAAGAPLAAVGAWTFTGSVFVISGGDGSLIRRHDGVGDDQAFGFAVGAAGDLDGDGTGELLIGAPRRNPNGVPRGGTGYVFSGATGLQLLEIDGFFQYGFLGWTAAGLDDLDGDGWPEICFSAPQASPAGKRKAGYLGIYSGATGLLYRGQQGEAVEDRFGTALATCPDVDGDGRRELLVGAPQHGFQVSEAGAAYLYSGGSGPLLWKWQGENTGDQLGYAVAGGGDLDGDGDIDVAIGAWLTDFGGTNAGSVYLVDGASGTLVHRLDAVQQSTGPLWFGQTLAVTGDLRGRGLSHLLAGIPDAGGFQLNGAIEIHGLEPFLSSDGSTLAANLGDAVVLQLDFPPTEAGASYAVLASGQGVGPTTAGGLEIPLTNDFLFRRMANGWNPPLLLQGKGQLDANGDARATALGHPVLAPHIGRTVFLAAVSYDAFTQAGRLSSIARALTIVP